MPSKLPQYTLRVPRELMGKFKYVSEYNARSSNRELELLIRNHVENLKKKTDSFCRKILTN